MSTIDASPTDAPTLTSHALVSAAALFVVSSDAFTFSPPSSGLPGAQLQLTCSTLALPVLVPVATGPDPITTLVSVLCGDTAGAVPPGAEVTVTVREVASGCLPGPPLEFSCTVDYVLPTRTLDAASGMALPSGRLLLFGLARVALSRACGAPGATLVVQLTNDAGSERTEISAPASLGATELWVALPCDARWTRLALVLSAPGCCPTSGGTFATSAGGAPASLPAPNYVELTTAPGYIARATDVDESVAGLLVAAGYTTIWQLRLLDKAAAIAAGVKPGHALSLAATLDAVRLVAAPLAPPATPRVDSPVWRFVSRALCGVDAAVLVDVVAYMEEQGLNTGKALAFLAAEALSSPAAADLDLAIGGRILPGYRASLVMALREIGALGAAPSPGPVASPVRGGGGGGGGGGIGGGGGAAAVLVQDGPAKYRHARIAVTRVLPGHGGRVQFAVWTTSEGGVEASREVVLKLAASRGELDRLLAAHEVLDGTGAVARRLATLSPNPDQVQEELGEVRYALVLEKVGLSLEEHLCAPDFRSVQTPMREMLARALLAALAKLHDAGWTHNDFWEANVMLEWNGLVLRVVLIDLDQAQAVGAPLPASSDMALTPVCAAPEYLRRWRGEGADAGAATVAGVAADTFCAGLVLARLLGSGSRVFADEAAALSALLPRGGGPATERARGAVRLARGARARALRTGAGRPNRHSDGAGAADNGDGRRAAVSAARVGAN